MAITSARLRTLARTLELRGNMQTWIDALNEAAAEIDVLNYTVEATTELAKQAARQSVQDRRQLEEVRARCTEQHQRLVDQHQQIIELQLTGGGNGGA